MDGFLPLENSGPRQALRPYYRINGAIYLMRVSAFRRWGKMVYGPECYACVMPRRRSVDIDTAFDFLLGEQLLRQERSGGDSRLFVNGSSSHEDNNRMIAPPPRTDGNNPSQSVTARFQGNSLTSCWKPHRSFVPGPARSARSVKGAPAC